MVGSRYLTYIIVTHCLMSPVAHGESMIRSVRISSPQTVHIKPCQPAFVVLDVEIESHSDHVGLESVLTKLFSRILINEREYLLSFNANPVVMTSLNRSSVMREDSGASVVQVVAMLYWNTEDRQYVFGAPGAYSVELYPGAKVDVVVEQPTDHERELLAMIRELGVEFAIGILNPTDNRARQLAPRVERMLQRHPDTAYTARLSVFLGTVKLAALRGGPGVDIDDLLRERVAVARRYYEPYCGGEVRSQSEANAAYTLALVELDLLKRQQDKPSSEAASIRRKAKGLLERVEQSPYSLDYGPRAASALKTWGISG